jgi:hypothetical protein
MSSEGLKIILELDEANLAKKLQTRQQASRLGNLLDLLELNQASQANPHLRPVASKSIHNV